MEIKVFAIGGPMVKLAHFPLLNTIMHCPKHSVHCPPNSNHSEIFHVRTSQAEYFLTSSFCPEVTTVSNNKLKEKIQLCPQ